MICDSVDDKMKNDSCTVGGETVPTDQEAHHMISLSSRERAI